MTPSTAPLAEATRDAIERLCACMRVLAAGGAEHAELPPAVDACIEAFTRAQPPLSLRFVAGTVLRERDPVPLGLESFRRAQILARAFAHYGAGELHVSAVPGPEDVRKLSKLLVDSVHGNRSSRAPMLGVFSLKALRRLDPLAESQDETTLDLVVRAEVASLALALAEDPRSMWASGQRVVSTLERCMLYGVNATLRALEVGVHDWTLERRAIVLSAQALAVARRLRAPEGLARAAAHALLLAALHGLDRKLTFAEAAAAAESALDATDGGPSPHRLQTATLLCCAADARAPELPIARFLQALYRVELERVPTTGPRRSRVDLQAFLVQELGSAVDEAAGRAILSALGPLSAGSHVLCHGRLGVVVGQGKSARRPFVLMAGKIVTPQEPVSPCSPLGMTPWAKG